MERISSLYPDVRFSDTGCREDAGWAKDLVEFYPPEGIPRPETQDLSNVLVRADYVINMPIMKKHPYAGVTLSFKNHFGSIWCPGCLHAWINGEIGDHYSSIYNPLVDLYQNPNIGDKTVLLVGDGLYGERRDGTSKPEPWETFGSDSPNSLFFSTDPVAIDSVMTDILHEEGYRGGVPNWADDYLELAAGEGLGVYERGDPWEGSEGYTRIDFIRCEDGVCPGAPSTPSPTCTLTPTITQTATVSPSSTPTATPSSTLTPLSTCTATHAPTFTRTPAATRTMVENHIHLPIILKGCVS
jgi:hypothetical protein